MATKTHRITAWVALALVLGASVAPVLAQALPWIVNDAEKACMPNPGIGLGGWYPSATCPDGFKIIFPKPPEDPWWVKLVKLLDSFLGLSNRVAFVFEASKLAAVMALVLAVKRLLEAFGVNITGKLNWALAALIAFIAYVQPMVADGQLTYYEAVLAIAWFVFGSGFVWKVAKAAVMRLPLWKQILGVFSGN